MINYLKERYALWKFKQTPLAQALRAHTQEYFYGGSMLSNFREENKLKMIGEFMATIGQMIDTPNPGMALREGLANHVLAYVQFQVLCLTEEEKKGAFYAESPFISGELHHRIRDSASTSDELASFLFDTPDASDAELIEFANARCALLLFYANGINMVRKLNGDQSQRDWFRPFVEAMLIWHEHLAREAMSLPSLFEKDAVGGLMYFPFLNYVVDGEAHPLFAYRKAFPDQLLVSDDGG